MKKIVVILVLVLSPFAMGLFAQCDSNDFKGVVIAFDHSLEKLPTICTDADPNPPTPFDTSEWRRIYFIHGLGGNNKAWASTARACWDNSLGIDGFPARKCVTSRPNYSTHTYSAAEAADYVRGEISSTALDDKTRGIVPSRSIIIAHSQGGIVSRTLMHLDMVQQYGHPTFTDGKMNYGGVVMVSSPLQGAAILKNRQMIINWANNGCSNLVLGPENNLAYKVPIIKDWIKKVLNNVSDKVCNVATDNLLPMFFKTYFEGITEDYNTATPHGVAYINMLNQDTLNKRYRDLPKIVFYGIEPENNLLWRTLNWMYYDPNGDNGANGPNPAPFEANDDWLLYKNTIKPMIDDYRAKTQSHLAEYNRLYAKKQKFFVGWFVSANKIIDEKNSWIAWDAGNSWFNNAPHQWQEILGAKVINGNSFTYKQSDGVVLTESSSNLPGATRPPVPIYPNKDKTVDIDKGSSHMQIRNDAGLKEHLNKLLNGDYGWWFRTPEQPKF